MSPVLAAWNEADESAAIEAMLACCAAQRWAQAMVELRPYSSAESLTITADEVWSAMAEPDWLEAFAAHPRIGERKAPATNTAAAAWSEQEQSSTTTAPKPIVADLAAGNARYEERFGFTYIVCATGKSAEEMLAILRRRLTNNREIELREAAGQQRRIMQIRLRKWLVE
jgi:OHCU decarboxylase